MAQRCRACSHPERRAIDQRLLEGMGLLTLQKLVGINRALLRAHRENHLKPHAATRSRRPPVHRVEAPPTPPTPEPPPPIPLHRRVAQVHAKRQTTKERFLEVYAETGNLTQAVTAAGVTRAHFYRWQEHDEQFALAFREAERQALETLEAEARERATKGGKLVREVWRGDTLIERVIEWRPSDPMLIKLLQALAPEKYGEKLQVTQTQIVKALDHEAWEAV